MTVYVDLIFLTNLAVDGTVLLTTAKVRRLRPSRSRIAWSAIGGAAYAAAMFVADIPYLYTFAAKIMVSVLMLLLSFGYGGPLRFLRNLGAFYVISFASLGCVLGLSSLILYSGSPWRGMTLDNAGGLVFDWHMQAVFLVLGVIVSIFLFRGTTASLQSRDRLETLIVEVAIWVGGEVWRIPGMLDTGNRLYDPLTRIPVMIVEVSLWRDCLPAGWADRLKEEPADRLIAELDPSGVHAEFAWSDRLRLVPYRGVNGRTKLMLAVKPDLVEVSVQDQPPISHHRVLIGLDGGSLSSEGAYRAIVHADLTLTGERAPVPSQTA